MAAQIAEALTTERLRIAEQEKPKKWV